ncbi:MAG: GNAT family N-acetyltransferase [Candidatus Nanohaloarchaea archaeon]
MPLEIEETSFEEVNAIHRQIPEFGEEHLEERYHDRCPDSDPSRLVARENSEKYGYVVAYDKFGDGSYYVWMAGVKPDYRREGVMSALVERVLEIADSKKYEAVKIKTRNERKAMRHLLINRGFEVCGYNEKENLDRGEIIHIKEL